MKNFDSLNLAPLLQKSLAYMKYDTPTPIQAKAIPFALEGRDIMGSAQTGTGKTAAFAIPLIQHLLDKPESCALILTPTRELGKQIMGIMEQLIGKDGAIDTAFLIGGDSMQKQMNQIKKRPRLVVGTPGRINDHLDRGTLKLKNTDFLVLDETDRMLDMGFSVQLDRIIAYLPKERQTLMFSATLPKDILNLSKQYLNNPERVAVGSTVNPADNIEQTVLHVSDGEKFDVLLEKLGKRNGSVIIFVKTKYATERMAKRLKGKDFDAQAIHGDMKQSRRARVIESFRDMKFQILVATDVVARGLDIPHIAHVINFDLPQVPEDFIHRIGRTARAGAKGEALSLVTPQEARKWHDIELLMNPDMKPRYTPEKRKGRGGRGKSTRGGKAHFKDKPKARTSSKQNSKKKAVPNPNANPNRNHKWDGTHKIETGDKPKSKKTDRGYREEKDTNKKSPFKKAKPKNKTGGKPSSGDKPLSRKKKTPKSGPQKGKKVYEGGKAKRNAAKRAAKKK